MSSASLLCFFVVRQNQAGRLATSRRARRVGSFGGAPLPGCHHLAVTRNRTPRWLRQRNPISIRSNNIPKPALSRSPMAHKAHHRSRRRQAIIPVMMPKGAAPALTAMNTMAPPIPQSLLEPAASDQKVATRNPIGRAANERHPNTGRFRRAVGGWFAGTLWPETVSPAATTGPRTSPGLAVDASGVGPTVARTAGWASSGKLVCPNSGSGAIAETFSSGSDVIVGDEAT